MEVIQEKRKESGVRQNRKDVLDERLEPRRELVRLERLLGRIDREAEQRKDGPQLRGALVQERDVLKLGAQALLELVDEAVQVRVEDDELPQDVRQARQLPAARRAIRTGGRVCEFDRRTNDAKGPGSTWENFACPHRPCAGRAGTSEPGRVRDK